MSAKDKTIEITGESPFKLLSGVFEVQIAICENPPLVDDIKRKNFPLLWKDNFHLRVKDKKFTQILGSSSNPLPDSIFQKENAWIVVIDQFSSIHNIFQIEIPRTTELDETKVTHETKQEPLPEQEYVARPTRAQERPQPAERGPRGLPGPQGSPGPMGSPGLQG